MEFNNQLKLVDDLVSCYRKKRKEHLDMNWHGTRALWGRICCQDFTFDKHRNSDLIFFQEIREVLRTYITSSGVSKEELLDLVLYLKGHRSIISERDFFLLVYISITSVALLIPRHDSFSWAIALIVCFFGVLAGVERWRMKRNDALYNELVEFLHSEVKGC